MTTRRPQVLLVEDDQDSASLFRTLLLAEDFEVHCCNNFSQALTFWANCEIKPDLLVLDMRLPDGDGLKLCQQIRSVAGESLPVLILSAHGDPRMPGRCRKAQVFCYLDKLKDLDRFAETARNLLQTRLEMKNKNSY